MTWLFGHVTAPCLGAPIADKLEKQQYVGGHQDSTEYGIMVWQQMVCIFPQVEDAEVKPSVDHEHGHSRELPGVPLPVVGHDLELHSMHLEMS